MPNTKLSLAIAGILLLGSWTHVEAAPIVYTVSGKLNLTSATADPSGLDGAEVTLRWVLDSEQLPDEISTNLEWAVYYIYRNTVQPSTLTISNSSGSDGTYQAISEEIKIRDHYDPQRLDIISCTSSFAVDGFLSFVGPFIHYGFVTEAPPAIPIYNAEDIVQIDPLKYFSAVPDDYPDFNILELINGVATAELSSPPSLPQIIDEITRAIPDLPGNSEKSLLNQLDHSLSKYDFAQQALDNGTLANAQNYYCQAIHKLQDFIDLVMDRTPGLIDSATSQALSNLAEQGQLFITDEMEEAGLLSCP